MAEVLIAPARSRVQAHFSRWRSRWSQMTADSFRRSSGTGLGTADTGVAWAEAGDYTPAAGQGYWELVNGVARPQQSVPAGNFALATLLGPSDDSHIACRACFTVFLPGLLGIEMGIFYRSQDGLAGRFFAYCGGGFYRYGTLDCTTSPATVVTTATVAGATWAIGETHLLTVDVIGSAHTLACDGTVIAAPVVASPGVTYSRHGLVAMGPTVPGLLCGFTRFRAVSPD